MSIERFQVPAVFFVVPKKWIKRRVIKKKLVGRQLLTQWHEYRYTWHVFALLFAIYEMLKHMTNVTSEKKLSHLLSTFWLLYEEWERNEGIRRWQYKSIYIFICVCVNVRFGAKQKKIHENTVFNAENNEGTSGSARESKNVRLHLKNTPKTI